MKKKVAIVLNRMIIGGAEKALMNLLHMLDYEKYDVTLFTLCKDTPYFKEIPPSVKVCFTKYEEARENFFQDIKHFRVATALKGIFLRLMIHLSRNEYKKLSYTIMTYPKLPGRYDCAIAYKLNYEDTATVLWRLNAEKKVGIMHSSIEKDGRNSIDKFILILLLLLDHIYCVSVDCKKQLISFSTSIKNTNKVEVMHNVFNIDEIIEQSKVICHDFIRYGVTFLTVGRLSKEKGFDRVPQVARRLIDNGYDFHWYIVGDGPDRERIEKLILETDTGNNITLLGTKENPYPYIKNCDIYVQPSYSEGYCTTTMEAKILHKPIVTTDVPGMREQFESGKNGLIVESSVDGLYEGIKTLLDNPDIAQGFIKSLESEILDNSGELEKLYRFIDS